MCAWFGFLRGIGKGDENGPPITFSVVLITMMAIYGRVRMIAGNENEIYFVKSFETLKR